MRVEELSIGNWVFDQDCEPYYFQIEQIRKDIGDSLWVYYRNGSIKCKVPEPIPLTEEILLKCGLSKNEIGGYIMYTELGSMLCIYKDGSVKWNDRYIDAKVKLLHQLQNLYFALTNEELNIEL